MSELLAVQPPRSGFHLSILGKRMEGDFDIGGYPELS